MLIVVRLTTQQARASYSHLMDTYKIGYALIGVILFTLILLLDTSAIIGGKKMMFTLGPECFILGAIQLYLEMINMFILAIVLLGS